MRRRSGVGEEHAARGSRGLPGRAGLLLASLTGLILVAAVAIGVSLRVTPMQTVSMAGQVIKVGTTTPRLGWDGPGEVDLFGQSLPTVAQFRGPVRPKLALTQITIDSELANFAQGSSPNNATELLGDRLGDGWTRYFAWEAIIAAVIALVLTGAVAGWRRLSGAATLRLLAAGLIVTQLVNLGAIVLTAGSARTALRQVKTLNALVGSSSLPAQRQHVGPLLPSIHTVVIGDSTASGDGLTAVPDPSELDRACGRSVDSYAEDLARANDWQVMNLACNGATVTHGLIGPQHKWGRILPAQLSTAVQAQNASVVIVSVGADDLQWGAIVGYCAAAPRCNDRASTAYFQQKLAAFSKDYFQLLSQLAALRSKPTVLINLYYDPFGPNLSCLAGHGLTAAKVGVLTSRLDTLNKVLATGAAQFSFTPVQPGFLGHQLCSAQPYVQDAGDPAPFHPTELGQLAIALADEAALNQKASPQQPALAAGQTSRT
jgi:hypothetical protein